MHGVRIRSIAATLVWMAVNLMVATSIFAQDFSAYKLGTNLDEVNDYSPQLPFKDIFRYSREWFTQCRPGSDPGCSFGNAFDTGEAAFIDLDANGWVRTLPPPSSPRLFTSVATFWDVPPEFLPATYVVIYDGSGTIEYELGARKNAAASVPGRDVIEVDPSRGGLLLRISVTDPSHSGNYIRNIRVVASADESTLVSQPFTTAFLTRLEPYQALRFMDWMRTNNSELVRWNDRAKRSDARYATAKGVPPEVMIDLANRTGKAPWFTMPAKADDEFVRNFALLARDTLNPALPIVVEYSNEVWNSAFSQGIWVEEQAEREFASSSESGFTKRLNWHGQRTAEICDLWKAAFGARASQVRCVLGAQAANSYTAQEALNCPLSSRAPCVTHGIGAVAIAPYFGDYVGQPEFFSQVRAWTAAHDGGLSQLFAELSIGGVLSGGPVGGALALSLGWIEENKSLANSLGLDLVAYEGGQHLAGIGAAGNDGAITALFTQANRDPRMATLYAAYLQGWSARNSGIFMHFTDISGYSKFGSWGALEKIGQEGSPKYDALRAYSAGSAPPTPPPFQTPTLTPTPEAELTPMPGSGQQGVAIRVRGKGKVIVRSPRLTCAGICSTAVGSDRVVVLDAIAARGSKFLRWRGACSHTRLQCRIAVRGRRTVMAEFGRR